MTKLTDNKFLNLYSVKDPENHVSGYQYAERRGIDSVAFICYDVKTQKFLLNNEYKPPVDLFMCGAFGGSMDKSGKTAIEIVKEELREEAGFQVNDSDIFSIGEYFVSTQMNQFCYLYLAIVNREKQGERHPENKIEAMAETEWLTVNEVMETMDWKAIAIMSKAKWMGMIE